MKNLNENIDYYFSIARQAPVAISIDQVNGLLAKVTVGFQIKPVKTIINSKFYIMSMLAVVTSVAVIISVNHADKVKSNKKANNVPVKANALTVSNKFINTGKKVQYPVENKNNGSIINKDTSNIVSSSQPMEGVKPVQKSKMVIEKKDSVKKVNYCCNQNKLQDSTSHNTKLQYDQIDIFGIYQENWARVENDHQYGFIDTSGREVVPVVYDRIDMFDMYKTNFALVKQDGKYGFIDITGKEIVAPMYDKIEFYGMYKENWALVKNDGNYGFIDNHGKEVVPTMYKKIYFFDMYRSNWALIKSDKRYGFIDTSGKEIVAPTYDKIDFFDVYRTNWALVERDKLLGFIDINGKEVVEPQYDEIEFYGMIKEGWARVKKDGQYRFIDKNGKEVEQ
jgi:hypothetical protein